MEEWKQKNQAPKFESRPPTVLKEKPFIPERKPMVVQMCPFNLHTEKRLQERKHYDEIKHKALEEKHKQVEIVSTLTFCNIIVQASTNLCCKYVCFIYNISIICTKLLTIII